MIVYPAIDLRQGQVVRLNEGDPNRQTTFSADPLATAQRWLDLGAEWLHIVNLDGAFDAENDNLHVLETVARLNVRVQFGGGLRDMTQIKQAIDSGADRVILGTVAVSQPDIVDSAIAAFGADAICIGLDARDGKITTHGWQSVSDLTPAKFGRRMAEKGSRHALYTDVARDGGLQGVNIAETADLSRETGLQVIASGGVRDLDDIRACAAESDIAGVIVGMALYTGKLDLRDALRAAKGEI